MYFRLTNFLEISESVLCLYHYHHFQRRAAPCLSSQESSPPLGHPMGWVFWDRVSKSTQVNLQNRFPMCQAVTLIHWERGIMVHCVPIRLPSLESCIQLISKCNSCTLVMSSLTIFWFSINFFSRVFIDMNFMSPLQCFHFRKSSDTVLSQSSFSISYFFVKKIWFCSGLCIPFESTPEIQFLRFNWTLLTTNVIFGKTGLVLVLQDLGSRFCKNLLFLYL